MIVYSIYCICNGGKPYYGVQYHSLTECKQALFSILEYNKSHRRLYYVDNDFYKNEVPYFPTQSMYYCIQKREVSDWVKLEMDLPDKKSKNSNIINFNQYIEKC